jgi:hypothetical protein
MAIFDCYESRAFHPCRASAAIGDNEASKGPFAEYERQLRSMQFTVQSSEEDDDSSLALDRHAERIHATVAREETLAKGRGGMRAIG